MLKELVNPTHTPAEKYMLGMNKKELRSLYREPSCILSEARWVTFLGSNTTHIVENFYINWPHVPPDTHSPSLIKHPLDDFGLRNILILEGPFAGFIGKPSSFYYNQVPTAYLYRPLRPRSNAYELQYPLVSWGRLLRPYIDNEGRMHVTEAVLDILHKTGTPHDPDMIAKNIALTPDWACPLYGTITS